MKKGISLLLSLLMILSVFSCLGLTVSAAADVNAIFDIKDIHPGEDLIRYDIYLKKGVKLNGAILRVEFDDKELEVVSGGAYEKANADGDLVQVIPGLYVFDKMNGLSNAMSIAYVSMNPYNVGSDKAFMTITFKYIGTDYNKVNVKFSCTEFNSPDNALNIPKDDAKPVVIKNFSTPTLNKIKYDNVHSVDNGILLSWKATKGAKGYKVYKYDEATNKPVLLKDTTALSYLDTAVKSGETARYIVRGYNDFGLDCDYEIVKTAFVKSPENVKASVRAGYNSVSWSEAKGAEQYAVYRREISQGNIAGNWVKLATVKNTVKLFNDNKNIANNKRYEYTVRSVVSGVECGSASFSAVTYFEPPTVSLRLEYDSVKISWNKIDGAKGYDVYRKVDGENHWTIIETIEDANADEYYDKTAPANKNIEYTVRAFNGNDRSSFVSKSTTNYAAPTIQSFAIKSNGIYVKWGAMQGAQAYKIYRKYPGGSYSYLGRTTSTSFVDTKAKLGAECIYTVRAEYNGKLSGFKSEGWSVFYLEKPVVKSVSNGYRNLTVSWGAIDNAEGYKIYRKENGAKKWSYIGRTTGTSYRDTKVKSGSNYTYTVRAYNGSVLSLYNNGKQGKYIQAPALKVYNTSSSIKLSWSKVSGVDGYKIYRKSAAGDHWKYIGRTTGSTYYDKNVVAGENYIYTIRSYDGNMLSGFYGRGWDIVRLETPPVPSLKNAASGVEVKWKDIAGAEAYRVYRKENSATKWSYIGEVKGNSYVDEKVKSGSNYAYTVRAVANGKLSDYNRSGKAIKYLEAPTLKVYNQKDGIKLSWSKVSNVDGYKIYRKSAVGDHWKYIGATTGTTYYDKNVVEGENYIYTIRSYDGKLLSGFYGEGWDIVRLENPDGIEAVNTAEGVSVSWNVPKDISKSNVYRKVNGESRWHLVDTVEGNVYVDKDVESGSKYTYTVRVLKDESISDFDRTGATVTFNA